MNVYAVNGYDTLPTVILTQAFFDSLPEYSCSEPTGRTIGKQWKCSIPYRKPHTHWLLREYIRSNKPGMVEIHTMRILIEGHSDPALWPAWAQQQASRELPVELL